MKLSELQIISYLHHVYVWCLALSEFWLSHAECLRGGSPGLSIYICINILILYLILTISTHEHYPIGSSRPQTQVYKPLFPAFFSQFLDFSSLMNTFSYTIKSPCVWPIWAFINITKHRHLEFLLLIPMEKNHFLLSSCILRHSNDVMCKQPIIIFSNINSV